MANKQNTVVLSREERKKRLGFGGVRSVATKVGVDQSFVSRVLNGKERHVEIEAEIASRVIQDVNEIAFPPLINDASLPAVDRIASLIRTAPSLEAASHILRHVLARAITTTPFPNEVVAMIGRAADAAYQMVSSDGD